MIEKTAFYEAIPHILSVLAFVCHLDLKVGTRQVKRITYVYELN